MKASPMIRNMTSADLPVAKEIIDSTGLFPSEMLDSMTAAALQGQETQERWLVIEHNTPIGIAYFAPEQMTEGTWNLYLIAVHADRHGGGMRGSNSGRGRGRSGSGNQSRNNRDRYPNWRPFPAELHNKPAPTDPSVSVTFDGVEYWYCTKHKN